jgi:hypothetical protein
MEEFIKLFPNLSVDDIKEIERKKLETIKPTDNDTESPNFVQQGNLFSKKALPKQIKIDLPPERLEEVDLEEANESKNEELEGPLVQVKYKGIKFKMFRMTISFWKKRTNIFLP